MVERECLVCGTAVPGSERDACPGCGGGHFVVRREASQRRPPSYGPGDHAAFMYDSEERCMSVLLPYVRDGVAAGNRVVGVVDRHTRDALRAELTSAEARRVGMITPVEHFGDVFRADRTYDAWSRLIAETDGVLRGFGGLDATTADSVDPAEWARYERSIGGLLGDDALGLCLYDTRHCSPELLECGAGHPLLSACDKVHVCA